MRLRTDAANYQARSANGSEFPPCMCPGIVNHITMMPTHLHEVLARFTAMPVVLITENLRIASFSA